VKSKAHPTLYSHGFSKIQGKPNLGLPISRANPTLDSQNPRFANLGFPKPNLGFSESKVELWQSNLGF
jgi:hypothetical protein